MSISKEKFKLILLLSILLVSMLTLSGCSWKKNSDGSYTLGISGSDANALALDYLEQKYGEKFEYAYPYGSSFGSNTHELLAKCESLPGNLVFVQIKNFRCEDKVFGDNYLAVKYHDEIIEFFQDCANNVFGEANIYYDTPNTTLPSELSANTTFDEFITDVGVSQRFTVEIRKNKFTSEEQVEQLADVVSEKVSADFDISVAIVSDNVYGSYIIKTKLDGGGYSVGLNPDAFGSDIADITKRDGNIEISWRKI